MFELVDFFIFIQKKIDSWIIFFWEWGIIHLPSVRWGSNLLLFCIPNIVLIVLIHNYHDDLEGFGWIGHVIIDWGNCLFSPEWNWSYISTPLGWHTSLRWMMLRNILQAFIFFSCFIFNRVWIISSIICLSLVRWVWKIIDYG